MRRWVIFRKTSGRHSRQKATPIRVVKFAVCLRFNFKISSKMAGQIVSAKTIQVWHSKKMMHQAVALNEGRAV
jgi:hypothetical protein